MQVAGRKLIVLSLDGRRIERLKGDCTAMFLRDRIGLLMPDGLNLTYVE